MLRFYVPNMSCGGCAKGVTRAVESVSPTASVEVDLATRRILVRGPADGAAVAAALRKAGFEASQLQAQAA